MHQHQVVFDDFVFSHCVLYTDGSSTAERLDPCLAVVFALDICLRLSRSKLPEPCVHIATKRMKNKGKEIGIDVRW